MDCFEENLDGFTYGYTWNGWACPYFDFENAKKLIDLFPDFGMRYDADADKFIAESEHYDREEWQSEIIDGKKYYPIGSHSWCWFEME